MFIFGHLGLGTAASRHITEHRGWKKWTRLEWIACALGTLTPDLIDKPLYYGISWFSGCRASECGLISGTRTFGHALLSWVVLAVLLVFSNVVLGVTRRVWILFFLGVATHLVFDNLLDVFFHSPHLEDLMWPFMGFNFSDYPYQGAFGHLSEKAYAWDVLAAEVVGILLLFGQRKKHKNEN